MAASAAPAPVDSVRDLTSGLVVFLVALPLCLGIALASGAPLFSGLLAGIIGGLVVGALSGSHTSVSGPAAGLTAVVVAQIAALGSFRAFQLALVLAGLIQVALGLARAGFIAAFFPSSVINGLLTAIGVILVLKQVPHVLGHDPDPEGDMAFFQLDRESTFSELVRLLEGFQPGAAAIGLASIALLVAWGRRRPLRRSPVPAPLVVVLLGTLAAEAFRQVGGPWLIEPTHLVQVPVADRPAEYLRFLQPPDFSRWRDPAIHLAALTLSVVASLETLLNLEAIDKIDPRRRHSPPSRELLAQGVGNVVSGLVGGIPVTSVIIRSSVNVHAGARTRLSSIVHGALLLASVVLLPTWLNRIPLSCLAAILLVTGLKLASPAVARRMWGQGRSQFAPFALTVAAIVLTDLLIGILIGLAVSLGFILASNMRHPLRRVAEEHLGGQVVRIELANQVSFLNRAVLARALDEVPPGGRVLIDARATDYIDPDVLGLIRDFQEARGPARGVQVGLVGFPGEHRLGGEARHVVHSTRELQAALSPEQVLRILKEGHERFRTGRPLTRDPCRPADATALGQHPLAVVLGCSDSPVAPEALFDMGMGDLQSVRLAGPVASREAVGSVEFGCVVAGARLVVVLGHTRCGAAAAAVAPPGSSEAAASPAGDAAVDAAARRNVMQATRALTRRGGTLHGLVRAGRVAIVGAMYDVASGDLEFLPPEVPSGDRPPNPT
ncbi:bifunctional SulP family inorganic anion transporter/carbonic anhydrase [Paludisphaera soli]|uniref:bifunctional SulP family inorganic anion transporter/carbonic anhydrase n=1 Tax=Paludisphaera soli TaxID=2712865 RepID=UPI0013ED1C78|nr:SulP family inorganic anion transporter [Paludisphaera soli]